MKKIISLLLVSVLSIQAVVSTTFADKVTDEAKLNQYYGIIEARGFAFNEKVDQLSK
jgi:hypothetical protein